MFECTHVYIGTLESFLKNSTSLTLSVMTGGVMLQGRFTELPWTAEMNLAESAIKREKRELRKNTIRS